MVETSKMVLAVLEDLFFNVKIADAAKRAGLDLTVVKTEAAWPSLRKDRCWSFLI